MPKEKFDKIEGDGSNHVCHKQEWNIFEGIVGKESGGCDFEVEDINHLFKKCDNINNCEVNLNSVFRT